MTSLGLIRSRTLICQYKAFIEITVPEELAVQIDKEELQFLDINWGRLEAIDKDGKEYKIEGTEIDNDLSVPQTMSWKVEESWPAKKAKIEEAYRKRIEQRLAVSRQKATDSYDLSGQEADSDESSGSSGSSARGPHEDVKFTIKELLVPFTDSPLHGTIPAKKMQ